MGKLSPDESAWVTEQVPAPLIPVSRVVACITMPSGQVCVTLAQDVPDRDGQIESVIMVRLLWPDGLAGKEANRKIAEMLADERKSPDVGMARRAH